MEELVSQILGLVVTLLCLIAPHFGRKWQILTCSLSANVLSGVSFLLIGEIGATGVCGVAILQILLGIRHDRRGTRAGIAEIVIFSFLYLASGVLPYVILRTLASFRPLNALPILGALFLMCSFAQNREQNMRLFVLANAVTLTVYTAVLRSTQIFAQICGMISTLVALIRYRKQHASPNVGEVPAIDGTILHSITPPKRAQIK